MAHFQLCKMLFFDNMQVELLQKNSLRTKVGMVACNYQIVEYLRLFQWQEELPILYKMEWGLGQDLEHMCIVHHLEPADVY